MKRGQAHQLINGSIGGLICGLALSQEGAIFMPIAISLLWASYRSPIASFIWGCLAVIISHRWLLALHPLGWIGVPSFLSLPIAISIWLSCGLLGGLMVLIWSFVGKKISRSNGEKANFRERFAHAIVMSALWGIGEVELSRSPFFWIGIGESLPPDIWELAGVAKLFGAGGVAMIQLLIGWWIWRTVLKIKSGKNFSAFILFGILSIVLLNNLGSYLLISDQPTSSKNIAVIQTNIPIRDKLYAQKKMNFSRVIQDSLSKVSDLKPSLFIAPEGTLRSNQELIDPSPIDLLSGGFRKVKGEQRSSLLYISKGEKNYTSAIDKYRLVPLGEWLPGWKNNGLNLKSLGGLQPGSPPRLFQWKGPSAAVAICYEISNGNALAKAVKEGASWIISIANLDPYPILLQKQFIALSKIRAVETGRELISVANTGPSMQVSTSGNVVKSSPPFKEDVLSINLNLYNGITPYTIWRDYPLFIILVFGLLFLIIL